MSPEAGQSLIKPDRGFIFPLLYCGLTEGQFYHLSGCIVATKFIWSHIIMQHLHRASSLVWTVSVL